LAKLGQNVGKVLADREQQKQAQEMLPMFQQSMQDAMTYANEGDSGLAFSKLMPFLTNPATLKNPYILPALDAGTKMIELAANDYARNIQVEAYRDRYSGGGGGGIDTTGDFVSNLNQGGGEDMTATFSDEQQAPAAVPPALQARTAAAQTGRGLPVMPQEPQEEVDMSQQVVEVPLPEQEQTMAQGPVKREAPPKNILEKFITTEDALSKMPISEQKMERQKTSIIFGDQKSAESYTPKQGRKKVELSEFASLGVPGVIGVELPDKVAKYVESGYSVDRSGNVSARINREVENDKEALAAINWLNDWQNASVRLNSNPDVRSVFNMAGNDALNVDVIDRTEDEERMIGIQVKGKPDTMIQLPEQVANEVKMLQSQTAAARTHDAKFLTMRQTPDKSPAQPTKRRVEVLTDKGGRYYLNAKGQKVYIK
jgi:hypothetical protein